MPHFIALGWKERCPLIEQRRGFDHATLIMNVFFLKSPEFFSQQHAQQRCVVAQPRLSEQLGQLLISIRLLVFRRLSQVGQSFRLIDDQQQPKSPKVGFQGRLPPQKYVPDARIISIHCALQQTDGCDAPFPKFRQTVARHHPPPTSQ